MAMKVVDSTQKFFDQSYFMEGGSRGGKSFKAMPIADFETLISYRKNILPFVRYPRVAKPTFVTKDKCYIFFLGNDFYPQKSHDS